MNLTLIDNQSLTNTVASGATDWVVVWHYTIIVLVMLGCAIVSWATVQLLFSPKWRGRFVRVLGLGKK
jgi:hypothetical protein